MADTAIIDVALGSQFQMGTGSYNGLVWIDKSVGYMFVLDSTTTALTLAYSKSSNATTWGSAVTFGAQASVRRYAIWYDKWTSGDAGTKIAGVYVEGTGHDAEFRYIDTADDSLSTAIVVLNGASVDAAAQLSQGAASITKLRNGEWRVAGRLDNDGENFSHEINAAGDTATSIASPFLGNTDSIQLLPGNYADNQDFDAIIHNHVSGTLTWRRFDDSAGTWSTVQADFAAAVAHDTYHMYHAVQRHSDGHILVAVATEHLSATGDLELWELDPSADTATLLSTVKSNVSFPGNVGLHIDQNTGNVYVTVGVGASADPNDLETYKSTDNGATFGSALVLTETNNDIRGVHSGYCTADGEVGRHQPVWFESDGFDVLTNASTAAVEEIDLPLTQVSYRVRVYDDVLETNTIYDSGIVTSATLSHTMPTDWLGVDSTTYELKVTVVDSNGVETSSSLTTFTLDLPAPPPADPPVIVSIVPDEGPEQGGTAVTITGTDFDAAATVTIGGVAATSVIVVNSTSITAVTPAGTVGAADVVVTHPDAQFDTLVGGFTFLLEPPNDPELISILRTPLQPLHPTHPSVMGEQ